MFLANQTCCKESPIVVQSDACYRRGRINLKYVAWLKSGRMFELTRPKTRIRILLSYQKLYFYLIPRGSWPFQTKSSSSAIISTSVTGTSYSYKCIQINLRNPIRCVRTFLLSILHSISCPAIPPTNRTPEERQKSTVFIANLQCTQFFVFVCFMGRGLL